MLRNVNKNNYEMSHKLYVRNEMSQNTKMLTKCNEIEKCDYIVYPSYQKLDILSPTFVTIRFVYLFYVYDIRDISLCKYFVITFLLIFLHGMIELGRLGGCGVSVEVSLGGGLVVSVLGGFGWVGVQNALLVHTSKHVSIPFMNNLHKY